MLQELKDKIWVHKWAPKTFEDIVLPTSILDPIKMHVSGEAIPHMLFTSVLPGSVKTTLANIIETATGAEVLKINASERNGIDVIRSEIIPFCTRQSIYGDVKKIVFLDEFDGTTKEFQEAFRVPMEKYAGFVTFIMTANNKEAISAAVQSRCEKYDFNLSNSEVKKEIIVKIIKRVYMILDEEGVEYDKQVVLKYVGFCKEREWMIERTQKPEIRKPNVFIMNSLTHTMVVK